MTDRVAMQCGHLASSLLFATTELIAEHEQLCRPIPPALCGDIVAGLQDITQHVMALEALIRSIDLLGDRDFRAAVTSLPLAERRALAQDALARSGSSTLRLGRRRLAR